MSYEKQAWSKYDALKPEEENIENGAVVTDSRMNHMENGISDSSSTVENHVANKLNPHSVTKTQVGLGNVDNIEQAAKSDFDAHVSNTSNPHEVTKSQIGLDKVVNVEQASKSNFDSHVSNYNNPHAVTASQTGAYTKGEVESKLLLKAVDSEVVHKENNENISGSKTFTGQTKVGNLEVTGNIKLTGMIGEWTNIPLVAGYTAGDGQTPQVRKVRTAEGLIRIDYRGAIGATSGNLPIAQVTVGTIPTDFLPLGTVLMQGSDNTGRGGRVACLTSGEMRILAPNTSAYVYLNSTFYYQ